MSLRSRIEELEKHRRGSVVLVFADGARRAFPKLTPLEVVEHVMRDGEQQNVVGGEHCGLLWQLLTIHAAGPVEMQGKREDECLQTETLIS